MNLAKKLLNGTVVSRQGAATTIIDGQDTSNSFWIRSKLILPKASS